MEKVVDDIGLVKDQVENDLSDEMARTWNFVSPTKRGRQSDIQGSNKDKDLIFPS